VQLVRLDRPAAELNGRIEARVAAMVRAGLVDEVQRLRADGFEHNPSAARAIGYREVLAMLDGKLASQDLQATIARNTRGLGAEAADLVSHAVAGAPGRIRRRRSGRIDGLFAA